MDDVAIATSAAAGESVEKADDKRPADGDVEDWSEFVFKADEIPQSDEASKKEDDHNFQLQIEWMSVSAEFLLYNFISLFIFSCCRLIIHCLPAAATDSISCLVIWKNS